MSHDHKLYDGWLNENVKAVHVLGKGTQEWQHTFVKILDYLAHPAIVKKN